MFLLVPKVVDVVLLVPNEVLNVVVVFLEVNDVKKLLPSVPTVSNRVLVVLLVLRSVL